MDKNQQIECFNELVERQREVMLSKGDDYANEDRLSNFKSAAYITGLTAPQHCLAMIATKVARLGVLLDPKAPTPKHESVQDSILDLANYAHLLNMIVEESIVKEISVEEELFDIEMLNNFYLELPEFGNLSIGKGDKYKGTLARKIKEEIHKKFSDPNDFYIDLRNKQYS